MKKLNQLPTLSFWIWTLAALFMFYKYILQNFPSVMTHELMHAFDIESLGLGVLSSAYFWTYLIVPLFAGILLDSFGVRWIGAVAILLAALGLFVFLNAQQLNGAITGRILMGVGASFSTLCYFKIAALWFSPKTYSLLTAILVSIAMLGAIVGQTPLAWFVKLYGWQQSLMVLSLFGLVLGVLFLFSVKDKQEIKSHAHAEKNLKKDILNIFKNPTNWRLTAFAGLAFSPVVIFCGLWGNPFLQACHQLDTISAPSVISLVFVGLALGSPLFALFEHRIKSRLFVMQWATLLSALCITAVIFIHPLPLYILGILLFGFGLFLGAFPWVFVIGKELNPLYLAGTTISMINASDAFFDALTEPLIGQILDIFGTSSMGYHLGLLILPLYQLLAVLSLKGIKFDLR